MADDPGLSGRNAPSPEQPHLLLMRDIVDGQLETVDKTRLARVGDVVGQWTEDGSLELTDLVVGPEAVLSRLPGPLGSLTGRLLRGRMEHRIPVAEVEELGPTVRLRGRPEDYPLGAVDDWIVERIFRFIPGSGR